jgi:hypothetical protein
MFPTQVLFSIACKCVAVVWLLVPTLGGVPMSLPVTSDSARCLCVSLLLEVLIVVYCLLGAARLPCAVMIWPA